MTDTFLLSHLVRPFHFDIGWKFSPASIRDQMLRGRVIVDRAYAQQLISARRMLLVIGAGAAGATAAIRAVQLGVRVMLIDRNATAFNRQATCTTRWVSPTQYDWPLEHWPLGQYPWMGPSMPLPWGADYADVLASLWNRELTRASRLYRSNLTFLPNTTVDLTRCNPDGSFVERGGELQVYLRPYGGPLRFGMALSCTGPGTEQSSVDNFSSFRFWDSDPYEKPFFGLGLRQSPRAVISGGGDGALQDFLRAVTKRRSAAEIYHDLPPDVMPAIENKIHTAEDQAQRAHHWSGTHRHDCRVFDALHRIHKEAVEDLFGSSLWPLIREAFDQMLADSPDQFSVKLVYPCTHFTKCYALNRFLVLLLEKYLSDKFSVGEDTYSPLVENTAVVEVGGTAHSCAGDPFFCHGKEHRAGFGDADCDVINDCLTRGAQIPKREEEDYDVIIIRHGVKLQSFLIGAQPVSNPRQLLPYYVPW
jgi:hypothetical protein